MHPNSELLQKFYTAFNERNYAAMIDCYHADVEFSDPVFPSLKGKEAGAMWHMLCKQALALKIEASGFDANESTGNARWQAWYPFSATKRDVHNIVTAKFEFKDGKIIKHTDVFNFWRWTRQALGPAGYLLGWSNRLHKTVSKKAMGSLQKFISEHPEYQ